MISEGMTIFNPTSKIFPSEPNAMKEYTKQSASAIIHKSNARGYRSRGYCECWVFGDRFAIANAQSRGAILWNIARPYPEVENRGCRSQVEP